EYAVPQEKRPADFDTDGDGIPDEWEIANGLNPKLKSDSRNRTLDPKGFYTNIEVYINSIVEDKTRAQLADAIGAVDHYFPATTSGINDVIAAPDATAVGFEYYTLDGRQIQSPADGLSIRVTILSDGTRITDKVIR
ncbi:MAG: thrombospondin type 3 repeat-containing protein, partial [Muribaculaceae bacterium]|nr:thrombospondin type 3 repeat-containing protein [Muribaculaceae bacterium]